MYIQYQYLKEHLPFERLLKINRSNKRRNLASDAASEGRRGTSYGAGPLRRNPEKRERQREQKGVIALFALFFTSVTVTADSRTETADAARPPPAPGARPAAAAEASCRRATTWRGLCLVNQHRAGRPAEGRHGLGIHSLSTGRDR